MSQHHDRIDLDRLRIVRDHLLAGDLSVDRFYFGAWRLFPNVNHPVVLTEQAITCGTLGCAGGELPFLFPDYFDFEPSKMNKTESYVRLKNGSTGDPARDIAKFFGLGTSESNHLFLPGCQRPSWFGGRVLAYDATREQVCNNFTEFIARAERGEF